jgi:hypothetical protein
MKLDESDSVVTCFRQLGDGVIPTDLGDGNLPQQVKDLERLSAKLTHQQGQQTYNTKMCLSWQSTH